MTDTPFIPEKKSKNIHKPSDFFPDIPSGVTDNPDYDMMSPILMLRESVEEAKEAIQEGYVHSLTLMLYAQAVSKPWGVNEESQPDYPAMAKECVEKARLVTPPLLQELGLLPKE